MNAILEPLPAGATCKPRKIVVPMATGLQWRPDAAYTYQEKLDGQFHCMAMGKAESGSRKAETILVGERMRDGWFIAFDIVTVDGQDVRNAPLWVRWEALQVLLPQINAAGGRLVESHHDGGALLAAVLARGGEGVVRKRWDAPYGEMEACKRLEAFHVAVMAMDHTQSVTIADAATGQPRGKLTLRGGKCDQVRVGSVLKVEGMGLTARGMIREPRVCSDAPTSWLIKF